MLLWVKTCHFGGLVTPQQEEVGAGGPPDPSFSLPQPPPGAPFPFQLLPPVPPGRGDECGLRELLQLRLAARHPPRPHHPLGAALLR